MAKDKLNLSRKQLDIIKELGNICAGNATIALSQILFKKIDLEIPTVQIKPLKQVASYLENDNQPVIGIRMETLGAINGQILLIFNQKSAYTLMEILIGNSAKQKANFITQIGISSLKEIGNIVISSYLSTLSSLSRLAVFPSCPQFTEGTSYMVIKSVFGSLGNNDPIVILIETVFKEQTSSVNGKFFIAMDSNSIKLIITACENALKVKD